MKRFLVGMGFSIVLISMGCAMSIFELKDFRVVNAYAKVYEDIETIKTTVNEDETLRIELDDEISIRFEIDNTMKDDVEMDVNEYLDYRFTNNKFIVNGHDWYNIPFKEYLDTFLDGLQEKKLYIYDAYSERNRSEEIIIHCSDDAKQYIRIID